MDRTWTAEELFPLVYDELRRLASQLARGREVAPNSLVHDAYVRLSTRPDARWERGHFVAVAARAMRYVLVDRARHFAAQRRGGDLERVTLSRVPGEETPVDVLALDAALAQLEAADPDVFAIVELRFFGGLSVPEVASALGLSTATVERRWRAGRALLAQQLEAR